MTVKNKINSNASIEDQVKQVIVEHFRIEDLKTVQQTSSFLNDFGADSLDLVELIMKLEEKFDIDIPDDEAEKIINIQEAVHYIKNHVGQEQES